MQCRSVLTRIDALRTGELPSTESSHIQEHMKVCRSCDDSLGDLETLTTTLKKLVVASPESVRAACVDHFDIVRSGGDTVLVAFSDRGLRMITTGATAKQFQRTYAKRCGRDLEHAPLPDALRKQVLDALSGEGVTKPDVDIDDAGEFERKVLEILTSIPRGEVRTYTWVAAEAGNPKAVRAVANVCARNVVPFVVPCHRVVPASGGTGNYAFGSPVKRALLRREGVPIDELDELAKRRVRYVGSKTTSVYCFPTCSGARRIRDENRIDFHDEQDAAEHGFRPCRRCRPLAA